MEKFCDFLLLRHSDLIIIYNLDLRSYRLLLFFFFNGYWCNHNCVASLVFRNDINYCVVLIIYLHLFRKFVYIRNLEFHKREHAGEVMFQCDMCEALFLKKNRLAEHKRFLHFKVVFVLCLIFLNVLIFYKFKKSRSLTYL